MREGREVAWLLGRVVGRVARCVVACADGFVDGFAAGAMASPNFLISFSTCRRPAANACGTFRLLPALPVLPALSVSSGLVGALVMASSPIANVATSSYSNASPSRVVPEYTNVAV